MAADRGARVSVGIFQSARNLTRTLEIFDMAGVVGPFLERANRVTSVAVIASGRHLAHMRFEPIESPYSFVAMVPQDVSLVAGDICHRAVR